MSLRLEKSFGTWFREYRPIYTPARGRASTRYLRLDHEFVGRAAHEAELAAGGPKRRLVTFVVDPDPDDPADVIGDEPVWHEDAVVGWVTSGGYGHHVQASTGARLRPDGAGDPGRTRRARLRDRDHRAPAPGPAPARAGLRPGRSPDAPVTPAARSTEPGRIVVDAEPIAFQPGDSVALAILRTGRPPARGGTLCLAGDCGNCHAEVDGVAYVRTCQTACRPGLSVVRHPEAGLPILPSVGGADVTASPTGPAIPVRRLEVDVAIVGGGRAGRTAAAEVAPDRTVLVLDAEAGDEIVGLFPGRPSSAGRGRAWSTSGGPGDRRHRLRGGPAGLPG